VKWSGLRKLSQNLFNFIKKIKILDPNTHCILIKKKQDSWEELGKEINRPVEKMENLLSSLRREKMKTRKSSGKGKGECF
jgi:hypothetical protein